MEFFYKLSRRRTAGSEHLKRSMWFVLQAKIGPVDFYSGFGTKLSMEIMRNFQKFRNRILTIIFYRSSIEILLIYLHLRYE